MEKKDYVSLEIAKALKSKGFNYKEYLLKNDNCFYDSSGVIRMGIPYKQAIRLVEETNWAFFAPSLYEAQKWLREKHNIHIEITHVYLKTNSSYINEYFGILRKTNKTNTIEHVEGSFSTYEETLNESIKQALEYI